MSAEIQPFRIAIPQDDLDDLRARLAATRWPRRLPGAEWSRGVPVAHLKALAEYWRDGYDWRAHEAELNAFPQFATVIDGEQVHFLHVRSPEPDALPLIMTHSWPNSIAEFTDVIGPLTDPRAHGGDPRRAFHVVAPSLPGFGFSPFPEPADDRPWSAARVAVAWAELMARLGYGRYGAHGNDAGALVSPQLALAAPEHVVGVHLTGGLGMPTGDPAELEGLDDGERAEVAFLAEMLNGAGGSGYAPYLARRPQTLSYGLLDSPVAQLAYLVERFTEFDGWPDDGGAPAEPIDRDRLLTNASLYWLTATAGSSSWTYYDGAAGMPVDQAAVPTGVSHGGSAVFRRLAERGNDIVHWADNTAGSHMIAMSDPGPLAADIAEFFGKLR
ncbi:pimeloyl-ACP methyl ester carboxylesterase [Murinocardiopsis flavida]|uniref:Pimeloyl-ACP methyl ester carboxylesterase n=1 Tax=Murinocardiopsis flavida TaxID=645275 RepID=A0A2P8CXH2_9ACTN|nr:epoxide hydrolase family protein [Murinocardiopsis flavida]PSK89668.1 pimeloyl-ACP methyl ester carboxylesterase [Murinocardiopsis flavida]